jgi:hypothetical protein
MHQEVKIHKLSGREFSSGEVELIQEVISTCEGLSRHELAHTVCELLDWKRPNGRLKWAEGLQLLEQLENQGILLLPVKKSKSKTRTRKRISPPKQEAVLTQFTGSVEQFTPIDVELAQNQAQRRLFRELVSQYHYLGFAMPFGARLQYLCYVNRPSRQVIGCFQFSSPAWRMKARDQWIGWDDITRGRHLQHIVNNSRFLVLAQIRNLSSTLLSSVFKRLAGDWTEHYGVEPYLVETLVDSQRFYGGCYRAANFTVLGQTSGRGRMDRDHQRHGAQVKTVMVYPLVKNARRKLIDGR